MNYLLVFNAKVTFSFKASRTNEMAIFTIAIQWTWNAVLVLYTFIVLWWIHIEYFTVSNTLYTWQLTRIRWTKHSFLKHCKIILYKANYYQSQNEYNHTHQCLSNVYFFFCCFPYNRVLWLLYILYFHKLWRWSSWWRLTVFLNGSFPVNWISFLLTLLGWKWKSVWFCLKTVSWLIMRNGVSLSTAIWISRHLNWSINN
jgi:hypothetical protein